SPRAADGTALTWIHLRLRARFDRLGLLVGDQNHALGRRGETEAKIRQQTTPRAGAQIGTWVALNHNASFFQGPVYHAFIPIPGGGADGCASPARFGRVCDAGGRAAASSARGSQGGGGWSGSGSTSPRKRGARGCRRRRGDSA